MLCQEEIDQVVIALDVLSTRKEEPLGLLALLRKHRVHRILVETVDQLDKVVLQEAKFLGDSNLECIERLLDEHLFAILSCQGENVDDDTPA